jgi:putative copper export protein
VVHVVHLVSVALHILAAAVWVGGMAFLALVVVPVVRRPTFAAQSALLVRETAARFRVVGWSALAVLIVTGVVNLAVRGYGHESVRSGTLFAGVFGHVLAVKLVLVALTIALAVLHDLWLGPRASAILVAAPGTPGALRARRLASWLGRVSLLLGIALVVLGVLLVRG